MTFINYQVSDVRRNVLSTFVKSLHQGNSDLVADDPLASSDPADLCGWDLQESFNSLAPLVGQLFAMTNY